jgi:chromodomain-helicase-DNA-binding protein 7
MMISKMSPTGVFLVVAPLSTLAHWQREFEAWTDLNTIVYHGSAEDRDHIRRHEIAYECDRPNRVAFNSLYLKKCGPKKFDRSETPWMVQVIITTPEMLVANDASELMAIKYDMLVVDEAHRMKNRNSKLTAILHDDRFTFNHRVLLTGTPIQNNVSEFWTLLNFCDEENYDDLDEFLEKYGDMKDKERVDELHEEIRPYILRRLKEDVEKSVPPKEETIIEVELTLPQKQYYRALYERNVKFLYKNKGKALDGPSLNNLAMQLRKCCNHVCLLNGVEDELRRENADLDEADFLIKGSGKLVLLDKLLPRLREEGHRVLLFSQFKIMLDLIEE